MQNPLLNFVNTIAWNVIVPGVTNPVTYGDSAYNTTSKWIGLKHSTDSCNQYIIKTSKKKEKKLNADAVTILVIASEMLSNSIIKFVEVSTTAILTNKKVQCNHWIVCL